MSFLTCFTYVHTDPSKNKGELRPISEADISELDSTPLRPVLARSVGFHDGWGLLFEVGVLKVSGQGVGESN